SDISWDAQDEEVLRNFKKGDEVEAVVLAVDAERERISLGIKQMDKDPFAQFMAAHPKGSIVAGKVKEVDAKGAVIELDDGIEGYLRASELSRERVEDATKVLSVGQDVEARIIGMDRKNRSLSLSVKAKEVHEEAQAIEEYGRGNTGSSATLGDLLKEHIGGSKDA